MRGDRVEVVVDVGEGTKTYEIVATMAGRRVEIGVVAVVEHPAEDEGAPQARLPSNQSSMI